MANCPYIPTFYPYKVYASDSEGKLNFGDIITNGINYWIVTSLYTKNTCSKCGHGERVVEVNPVILNDNRTQPQRIEKYNTTIPSQIKPYWKLYMEVGYYRDED